MIHLYRVFSDWRVLLYSELEDLPTEALETLTHDMQEAIARIGAELERRKKILLEQDQ